MTRFEGSNPVWHDISSISLKIVQLLFNYGQFQTYNSTEKDIMHPLPCFKNCHLMANLIYIHQLSLPDVLSKSQYMLFIHVSVFIYKKELFFNVTIIITLKKLTVISYCHQIYPIVSFVFYSLFASGSQ